MGHRKYVDAINLDGSAASSKDSNPRVLDVEAEQKRNWAKTVYYPALDALISECSQRFSSESMGIACGVDAICYVNFHGSESLIRHYANLLSLDLDLVRAEMSLFRAMIPDGPLSTAMKTQIKKELLKGLYPRVVNGPTRSGPNPARTQKCKPEPENNLKLKMSPKKPELLFINFCSISCKILFNFTFINLTLRSTAVQH